MTTTSRGPFEQTRGCSVPMAVGQATTRLVRHAAENQIDPVDDGDVMNPDAGTLIRTRRRPGGQMLDREELPTPDAVTEEQRATDAFPTDLARRAFPKAIVTRPRGWSPGDESSCRSEEAVIDG